MRLSQLWTTDGLLTRHGSKSVGLRSPLIVQSLTQISNSEDGIIRALQAGLIELSVRIGLECLFVPTPIFERVFTDNLTQPVDVSENGIRAIIGWSPSWLSETLPACDVSNGEFQSLYTSVPESSGILWLSQSGVLVATGKSPQGLLLALRALASDNFGQGFPQADKLIITENSTHTEGGDTEDATAETIAVHDLFSNIGSHVPGDTLRELDIQVGVDIPVEPFEELLCLTSRIGLQVGHVRFPVTRTRLDSARGSAVQLDFSIDGAESYGFVAQNGREVRIVAPTSETLSEMLTHITETWFDLPEDVNPVDWRGKLAAICSAAPDIRLRARSEAILNGFHAENKEIQALKVPDHLQKSVMHWCAIHDVPVKPLPSPELFRMEWQGETEWDLMRLQLHDTLENLLKESKLEQKADHMPQVRIQVEVYTTVPETTFDRDIQTFIKTFGKTSNVEFIYRNVTKAGLSWFLMDVLPWLKQNRTDVANVQVSARELVDHTAAEQDSNMGNGYNRRFLDLPQRYLQEFFPIDAIVEREVGIDRGAIHLSLHGDELPMYLVTARDSTGKVIRRWEWDSLTEDRTYMPNDTNRRVMVPAAGYRVWKFTSNSKTKQLVSSFNVPTVYTQFWDWYQRDVVSTLIVSCKDAGPTLTAFSRLEAEVWVDGSEERLGVYEEVISWPEALHEDLYFYTLQALREHGETANQPIWKTPGLIVPQIHSASGNPKAEIRVVTYASNEFRLIMQEDEDIQIDLDSFDVTFQPSDFSQVRYDQGEWSVFGKPLLNANERTVLAWLNTRTTAARRTPYVVEESPLDPPGRPIVPGKEGIRVLQNNDIILWLNSHRDSLPGTYSVCDYSFQGRQIIVVELCEPISEGLTSRKKAMIFKPTIVVFARHHANEVSSTNSAVHLIERVISHPEALQLYNIVVVPIHNVDGAALHRQLLDEHPYWKHHAARFNACGYEFGQDYFRTDTPFGESRVASRLWNLWKPDIVLDDHGIPSHEWLQPFSGYHSPPSFPESYWIPHAQIYTIWRELTPDRPLQPDGLIQTVSRVLDADATIHYRNHEFFQRYVKWGKSFSPAKFPGTTVDGVMTYRWKNNPSPTSTSFIGRYPDFVTADIVTEVNDETVHGEALYEVVYAHSKAHEGIFEWLSKVPAMIEYHTEAHPLFARMGLSRRRPIGKV